MFGIPTKIPDPRDREETPVLGSPEPRNAIYQYDGGEFSCYTCDRITVLKYFRHNEIGGMPICATCLRIHLNYIIGNKGELIPVKSK